MKSNPMLKALDVKIAGVMTQQLELERQLAMLKNLRSELAPLVRKRGKPKPLVQDVSEVA